MISHLPPPKWLCARCGALRPKTITVGWSVNQTTQRWLCPPCTREGLG